MTDEERANIDINGREHYNRVWGSKIQVIGWSLYACILWSLKFCITAFYGRLTCVPAYIRTLLSLTSSQLRIDSPQNSCDFRLHHSRRHIFGRRSYYPAILPTVPSLLAGHTQSWSHLPTHQLAGVCTGGGDSEHLDGCLLAFYSFACKWNITSMMLSHSDLSIASLGCQHQSTT